MIQFSFSSQILFLKPSLEYQLSLNRSTWSSMYWLIPRRWNDIVDSKERDPIELSSTPVFGLLLARTFKYFMKLIVLFGQRHIQRTVKQINGYYYDFLKLPYDLIQRLPFFFFFLVKRKKLLCWERKKNFFKGFPKRWTHCRFHSTCFILCCSFAWKSHSLYRRIKKVCKEDQFHEA